MARKTIINTLKARDLPDILDVSNNLKKKAGVFVTLNKGEGKNSLRGCIGLPYPVKPIANAVKEAAQSAAFRDPRFPPLDSSELDQITVEVSVLTPPELIRVDNPSKLSAEIQVGRDGLIVSKGSRSGLLLPQVAMDWGWDSEEFLCQCCRKAWLPMDTWLDPDTKIKKFQSIIFKEDSPNGQIKRVNL